MAADFDDVGDEFDWLDGENCTSCGLYWEDCTCL